jgi:hypothetical protein
MANFAGQSESVRAESKSTYFQFAGSIFRAYLEQRHSRSSILLLRGITAQQVSIAFHAIAVLKSRRRTMLHGTLSTQEMDSIKKNHNILSLIWHHHAILPPKFGNSWRAFSQNRHFKNRQGG